jgi:chemotaxis protein MotB
MKNLPIHPSPQENYSDWPAWKRTNRQPLRLRNMPSRSEKGHDIWLLTLSDLLLLLTIFFVFLFGTILQQTPGSYSLGPQAEASIKSAACSAEKQPACAEDASSQEILVSLETDLRVMLGNEESMQEASVTRQARHLVLAFPERIVFDPGQAQIKPAAKPILDKVASLVSAHPDLLLEVQGHTDDRPINNKRYPSNWELSVDRATQVVKALIGLGLNPSQISLKGFGEYRALYPNDSDSNRLKNRRVEIQFSLTSQL